MAEEQKQEEAVEDGKKFPKLEWDGSIPPKLF